MLKGPRAEYDPSLILRHFLQEFPQTSSDLPELRDKFEKSNRLERLPRRFIFEQSAKLLDKHTKTGELVEIRKLAEFVNTNYGHSTKDDLILQTAFINRLPDPQIDTELAALLSPSVRAVLDKKWDWREVPSHMEFILQTCAAFPQLQPLADDNTYGRENDVLSTLFMGDVRSQLVDNIIDNAPKKVEEVKQILDYFEDLYGRHEQYDYLIEHPFFGTFPHSYELGYNIVELLGPKLEAAYRKQWNIPDDEPLISN